MRIGYMNLGVAAALVLAGAAASPAIEISEEPLGHRRRDIHKPSGSKPVSGGGARERARRLAKMTCDECGDHIGHCECHVTPA
jgi:hypothetical protein